MILSAYRLIFLHVPKTGGNAIQSYLLPYSDDRRVLSHQIQDGIDRFGLTGPVTPTKHATLQDYADRLGGCLADYRLMLTLRHPVDRALSMYYSPHWALMGKRSSDPQGFDFVEFVDILNQTRPAVDFVTVDGGLRRPEILLRFDALAADLGAAAAALGIPPPPVLPRLNTSVDKAGVRTRLRSDARIIEAVRRRFAPDYEFFGFSD